MGNIAGEPTRAPRHRQATALVEAGSGNVVVLRGLPFFSNRRLQEKRDKVLEELARKLMQQLRAEPGSEPGGHGILHLVEYELPSAGNNAVG